jgi:hypothetical protein
VKVAKPAKATKEPKKKPAKPAKAAKPTKTPKAKVVKPPAASGTVIIPGPEPTAAKTPAAEAGGEQNSALQTIPEKKTQPKGTMKIALWAGLGAFAVTILAVFASQFLGAKSVQTETKNPFTESPGTTNDPTQTPAATETNNSGMPEGILETESKPEAFLEKKESLPQKPNQFAILETTVLSTQAGKNDPERVFFVIEVPEQKSRTVVAETSTKALTALVTQGKIKAGTTARITLGVLPDRAKKRHEKDRKIVSDSTGIALVDFFDIEEYASSEPKPTPTPAAATPTPAASEAVPNESGTNSPTPTLETSPDASPTASPETGDAQTNQTLTAVVLGGTKATNETGTSPEASPAATPKTP